MVETWRRGGQDYFVDFHSNYFTDLINLSSALGLLVQHKSAVAVASLVGNSHVLVYVQVVYTMPLLSIHMLGLQF